MRRYQYTVGGLDKDWSAEDEQTQLNKMGCDGWALISVVAKMYRGAICTFYYFMREIHDGHSMPPNMAVG